VCLVGINGPGKSNFLELVAEIFFYVESFFLKYIPSSISRGFKIKFEIEYYLPINGKRRLIAIRRLANTKPNFFIVDTEKHTEIAVKTYEKQLELLPKRIIGYSSGNNETLSTVFKTSRTYYSIQVGNQAVPNSKNKLDPKDVVPPRLLYMDYKTNELIVVSNYLFKSSLELQLLTDLLRIESLHSFRIILQFNHTAAPKGGIKLTDELKEVVDKLVKCATSYFYDKEIDSYILDYYNHKETRDAFLFHFKTAETLFTSLYKLVLLNPLCVKGKENRKWAIQNDLFPPDKAFRIERLRLNMPSLKTQLTIKVLAMGSTNFSI
jgi:hypothetical protein